jgi:hypothetical protein
MLFLLKKIPLHQPLFYVCFHKKQDSMEKDQPVYEKNLLSLLFHKPTHFARACTDDV